MPKIGMRIVKSALVCIIIGLIYMIFLPDRNPFYALIASLYSMRADSQSSLISLKNRTIATIIGGVFGYFVLLIQLSYFAGFHSSHLEYLFAILFVLPIIYLMVAIKLPDCAYLTCVVFFSITITQKASNMDALLFMVDRVIDTEIGAVAAVLVNLFHLPRKKDFSTFFFLRLENTFGSSEGKLTQASIIQFQKLLHDQLPFTFFSSMTPGKILKDTAALSPLPFPVVLLNGACAYNTNDFSYFYKIPIQKDDANRFEEEFALLPYTFFSIGVHHQVLTFYCKEFFGKEEEAFFHEQKIRAHQHVIFHTMSDYHERLGYLVFIPNNKQNDFTQIWNQFNKNQFFKMNIFPEFHSENSTAYLIISSNVTEEHIFQKFKQLNLNSQITNFLFIDSTEADSTYKNFSALREKFYKSFWK